MRRSSCSAACAAANTSAICDSQPRCLVTSVPDDRHMGRAYSTWVDLAALARADASA